MDEEQFNNRKIEGGWWDRFVCNIILWNEMLSQLSSIALRSIHDSSHVNSQSEKWSAGKFDQENEVISFELRQS